jgi:thioesterase domain-containing protein
MSTTEWLPSSRTEQLAMAKNWNAILPDKAAAWGIPSATVQTLDDLTAAANEVLSLAITSARNAVTNQQVRTAFGELTDCMRDIKRRHFFIPPLRSRRAVSGHSSPAARMPLFPCFRWSFAKQNSEAKNQQGR